jgi:hypothetical protein
MVNVEDSPSNINRGAAILPMPHGLTATTASRHARDFSRNPALARERSVKNEFLIL